MENNQAIQKEERERGKALPLIITNLDPAETELSISPTVGLSQHIPTRSQIDNDSSAHQQSSADEGDAPEEESLGVRARTSLEKGWGKKMKIFIYVLLLVSIIGNGSSEKPGIKHIFQILEQVCQGAFLVLFFLELVLFEVESRA